MSARRVSFGIVRNVKAAWSCHDDGDVEIFIDMGFLARVLGSKALSSKGGKSQAVQGAVEVRVVRREDAK